MDPAASAMWEELSYFLGLAEKVTYWSWQVNIS